MSWSLWSSVAADAGDESEVEVSEGCAKCSVSSTWGSVAAVESNADVRDRPCAESFLSGWAAVASSEKENVVDGGEEIHVPVLHIDLSEHVEPASKRRGRPRKCFASLASHIVGEGDASECYENSSARHPCVDLGIGVHASASSAAAKIEVAQMTVSAMDSYVRQPINGYRPLSVCAAALVAACSGASSKRLDAAYAKIQAGYIDSCSEFHVTSNRQSQGIATRSS
eukprot:6459272-Amphidinium_carterae.4